MWLRVHLRLKQRGMLSHLPDILRPPVARPGKDKLVKYWDADKFEHLLTLEGHHAEVGLNASWHAHWVLLPDLQPALRAQMFPDHLL